LPSAIVKFESEYAQNEKRRRAQEELYNDLSKMPNQIAVVQTAAASEMMGDTVKDLINSVTEKQNDQAKWTAIDTFMDTDE
ncbi:unnamed protein product, partial [Rotaria magnacalcarata]